MTGINFFTDVDPMIISLWAVLFFAIIYIVRLKMLLSRERNRRMVPLLGFEFDEFGRGVFVKNEGLCAAKDIKVDDIVFNLDYDFKKTLVFKFEPIEMIGPGKKEELIFKIYDQEYLVASEEFDNILGRLSRDSFEAHLTYSNLKNVRYSCILIRDKEKMFVKEVVPCV